MPINDRAHKQEKTSSANQKTVHDFESINELQQQTHPATIIQGSRFDPSSLSANDVMQLQRTLGNKAVGALLDQRAQQETKSKELITKQDTLSREGAYKPGQGDEQKLISYELTKDDQQNKTPTSIQFKDKPKISANNNTINVVQRLKEGQVASDPQWDHWISDAGTDLGRVSGVSKEKAQKAEKSEKSKARSPGVKGMLARATHKVAKKVGLEKGSLEDKRNRAKEEKMATINATMSQKYGAKAIKAGEMATNAGIGLAATATAPVTGGASFGVGAVLKQGVSEGAKKATKRANNSLAEAKTTGYNPLSDNEQENDTPENLREQEAEHTRFMEGPRSSGPGGGRTIKKRVMNAAGRTARVGAEIGAGMIDPTGLGAKAAVGLGGLAVDVGLEEGSEYATSGKQADYGKLQEDDD